MFGQKATAMTISVNDSQRLYVIKNGEYTSCHGFDVVHDAVTQMCGLMSLPVPLAPIGSLALYQVYQELTQRFQSHSASRKTWFQPGTDADVARILLKAIDSEEERILRIFVGNPATGYDWCEENDVTGFIGRSTGTFKVPLILEALRTSTGAIEPARYGDSIACQKVIRIIDVLSGKELFRNEKYQMPRFQVEPASDLLTKVGYSFSVMRDDMKDKPTVNVANFKSLYAAEDYVAFMKGHKVAMPLRTKHEAMRELQTA